MIEKDVKGALWPKAANTFLSFLLTLNAFTWFLHGPYTVNICGSHWLNKELNGQYLGRYRLGRISEHREHRKQGRQSRKPEAEEAGGEHAVLKKGIATC